MKPTVQADKVVVLSGSGLSAESGLPTFRDSQGLWNQYTWQQVASPEGWRERPDAVLAFYNERRRKAWQAQPNAAHLAIAELEQAFEVVVITQNVDALHERAGSTCVLHVHGELAYARGTGNDERRYRIDDAPIVIGQRADDGSQLRPDIVWFGEQTRHMEEARAHVASAARVLVVGTSLTVQPAASLAGFARGRADKVLVSLDMERVPHGYRFLRGPATQRVPPLVQRWLAEGVAGRG
jgi:NAD-dependent deacetylase